MIPQSRPLPKSALGFYHDGTCYEVGHTWHPSCICCFLELFYNVYIAGLRVYAPLYLLSDLVRRTPIKKILTVSLPNTLRSSLFLAVNGSGFVGFLCIVRHLIGRFYFSTAAYLPASLASLCAILVERKSRRGLLCGYTLTLAVEAMYRMLKFRGFITPVPYGEVILFSIASAVLLPAYRSKEGLHDFIGSVLSVLFHPQYPKGITRLVESIRQGPFSLWRHTGYVTAKIALLSLWCYLVGYITQTVIGLVSTGTKTFKRWKRLKQVLFNGYNVRFGTFIAVNIGGFKVLEALLFLLPVGHRTRITIAGLLAGISMIILRSSSLSLYAATKAVEVLYMKAVKRGWARNYYYGDTVLYTLSTALVLHTAFFEAHNVRRSYWHFLNSITGQRISQLNWDEVDRFGTQASKSFRTNTDSENSNEDS